MTVFILAILLMASVALTGWRQGAIRAAFAFVDIFIAALLAVPLGKLVHPVLPYVGASNPVLAWALAPVIGFFLAGIPLRVVAHKVHNRIEHFYKYQAGDLRLALWERLIARLGICIGILNGAVYFVLISFYIYNLTYWTTQLTEKAPSQNLMVRLVNQMGKDLDSTGFARTACAVGTLPANYYKFADLAGLLLQNPQIGPRLAEYPGLTSLWQRDDVQPLVNDAVLTKAAASGASLGEIVNAPAIQALKDNKDLAKLVLGAVTNQYDDLMGYLQTGKSAKFDSEKIIGNWEFNPSVTLAWLRQEQPKMTANDMRAIRSLWMQAYAQTKLLFTGDNQLFIKNLPKFVVQPQSGQPPFQGENWKGDWSRDGGGYSLHATLDGADKFMSATTDGLRLTIKDGRNQLIFDHAD